MAQMLTPAEQSLNSSSSIRDPLLEMKINEIIEVVGPAAEMKDDAADLARFNRLTLSANEQQIDLLIHISNHILNSNSQALQLFINGPAGSGKTFAVKLIEAVYNRFAKNDGLFNTYILCAPRTDDARYINGGTVHSTFKIKPNGNLESLSISQLVQYRLLFKDVKVIIIDNVNMLGQSLFKKMDYRLKQFTENYNDNFGGLDIILIGDFRQLPPIRDSHLFQSKMQYGRLVEKPLLWQAFKVYDFERIDHQGNELFSDLLITIGNGDILSDKQKSLLEARFFTKEEAARLCPKGVYIFDFNANIGVSFDSVIYHYSKNHKLPLVYLAMSRAKTLEGLYIVPDDGDLQFYHCRKTNASVLSLKEELRRLSANKLTPINTAVKSDIRKKLFESTLNYNRNETN